MEIIIVVGAVLVAFLVFSWLLKVVKTTLKTALLVAFVLLALQLIFGIGPAALWQQLQQWLPGSDPAPGLLPTVFPPSSGGSDCHGLGGIA